MTNVKLKLMFFLLNALLTADIVHARPYSDSNSTDIVIKFSNSNNTFKLPVKSNSDTLIVANEDETPEETNKSSNNQMEAIMTAEQDRDKDISGKNLRTQKYPEETSKKEPEEAKSPNEETPEEAQHSNTHMEAILNAEQDRDHDLSKKIMDEYNVQELPEDPDKKRNVSSPLLEKIMAGERDREGTITDILFRPDSEYVEPKFEFLIAAKINESDVGDKSVNTKGVSVSDNNLDRVNRNGSDITRKVDYVELVEVTKISKSENMSAYMSNITVHEVDDDLAPDTRFTDVQTLFLACFATLLPLLAVLFATLLIRCMCRRWCPGCCRKPLASSQSDSSEKQDPSQQQLKSPTSGGEGDDTVENGEVPPANGSIFTMTLKNNHLIVEAEERNDITKNGRETKMKYSPDNEGIFVVEVQQSTAYRPNNKALHNSPPHDPQISTNQALIHRVPEELEKKIIEEDSERSSDKVDRALALSSTGLSISDLSMSSIGSHNISYSYGSQMGYELGPFGYPLYAGYDITKEDGSEGIVHDNSQEPLISKTPTDPDKPVVTAAIFKQDSIIGNDALQGPGYCIEGSSDGPLLSDVQAREFSLQHLHDQREKKLENGVAVPVSEKIESTKKALNRADSLPVRLEKEIKPEPVVDKNSAMEPITENETNDFDVPSKDALKGKRASLPIIRTEVYESVKDVIRPSGSPKFEKLMNDTSPGDNTFDAPPLITITEESESAKSDSTS